MTAFAYELISAPQEVDSATFRHVLGHVASTVTVVTSGNAGSFHGTTVSAFSSLSLDPPLVLVCINRQSTLHPLIIGTGRFAVNILPTDAEAYSRHFASRAADKFAEIDYRIGASGLPLLDAALASIECDLIADYPGGDHSIFVGKVIAADVHEAGQPLVYFRGKYHTLS